MDNQYVQTSAHPTTDGNGGGVDPNTGMVESNFISKLRETILPDDEDDAPWPPEDFANDKEKALTQMNTLFKALFMRVERKRKLPDASPKSALGIVSAMLAGSKWPKVDDTKFPVPAEYQSELAKLSFRRYEVSCAISLFYHAFNEAGGAGSPTEWPPKN